MQYEAQSPCVRVGVTVAKRLAGRSVDRSTIKRVLRESFRHAAARIEPAAVKLGADVGVSFRLKEAIGPGARAERARWKQEIRAEADRLLDSLFRELDRSR
jgi:hypothetical protein